MRIQNMLYMTQKLIYYDSKTLSVSYLIFTLTHINLMSLS